MSISTDPVEAAMADLLDDGLPFTFAEHEKLSLYLAGEFRKKLHAAEKALADKLPPVPWSAFAEALSSDGYIQMKVGLRRLGERP